MKQIILTISANGSVQLETQGFAGSECQTASRFLKQALGESLSEKRTSEFYQPASLQNQTTLQEG